MSVVNNIRIFGRLTKDPEIRVVGEGESGFKVAKFSVAVNRSSKKDNPETDFFDVQAFRGKADVIEKYFHKGSRILVSGEMHFDSYKDKDGNNRKASCITLDDFGFVDSASGSSSSKSENRFTKAGSYENKKPKSLSPADEEELW